MYFCYRLDKKPVSRTISQELSTAIANFLALFFGLFLIAGISVAYDEILWSRLRRKPLRAAETNNLISLISKPWNLFLWPAHIRRAPLAYLTAFIAAGIPFAAVFPPGALTTEFRNVVPVTLRDVPTMNISDYGNGTYLDFMDHSLFEMNGDFSFM